LCETVELRVETTSTVLTGECTVGQRLRIPINHFEGNYVCDETMRRRLRDDDRIVLRYVRNPNGSLDDIAGVCNEQRNVVGLMPHPERASDALLGSTDGVVLLRSLLASAAEGAAVA
jgi:phosphoribosylformylglycinamidine synthase